MPDVEERSLSRPRVDRGRGSPFLDRLDPLDRAEFDALGTVRRLDHGELLFLQGERAGRVAIVLDGMVKVSAAADAGRSALMGLRRQGDLVGEVDALVDGSRDATVTSIGATKLRLFSVEDFADALDRLPSAASALARSLAWDLRAGAARRLRAGLPVQIRLAAAVVDLVDDFGTSRPDGSIEIELPLSQDDLAALVDSSRDAVAKTLAVWRRQRIVETGRRKLVVLDWGRLCDRARVH